MTRTELLERLATLGEDSPVLKLPVRYDWCLVGITYDELSNSHRSTYSKEKVIDQVQRDINGTRDVAEAHYETHIASVFMEPCPPLFVEMGV